MVLADGSLQCNGLRGSIHHVARELLRAPCNGWEHWFYLDTETGQRLAIDALREKYLAEASGGKE